MVGLAVLPLCAAEAGGERLFMDSPDIAMKAFEPVGQMCKQEMHYALRAASQEVFLSQVSKIEVFLGGLRGALSVTCPAAQKIVLIGYIGNDFYFAGTAEAKNDWKLIALSAKPHH
ncbi:hypothetical protein FHS83_002938 [Rhizomicrobium palustre]|uniref:Uncharacterized protein n=1 Tax=Rhizomicrobium palustre TaxID=189966 RepID=A0A846N3G8_9PROT|nr:hypothetical protein [Rhizomicrobium palustre]NIK89620.1 hypothetical protein [Rhizomicrobium palustre]